MTTNEQAPVEQRDAPDMIWVYAATINDIRTVVESVEPEELDGFVKYTRIACPPTAVDGDMVTNGAYEADDFGHIGDAARRIASYTEGDARQNVYRAAKQELAAIIEEGKDA